MKIPLLAPPPRPLVPRRRLAAAAVALAVLCVGAAVYTRDRQATREAAAFEARSLAAKTAEQAASGLKELGSAVLTRATTAASLAPVQRMVGDGVDGATWDDFLAVEAAWAPFRAGASAIVVGQSVVAGQGERAPDEVLVAVARAAAASGSAVAWEGLRLLGAARVGRQGPTGLTAVVVLAEPLEQARLEALARQLNAAIAVSADELRLIAGAPALQAALTSSGAEAASKGPCCASTSLGSLEVRVAIDEAAILAAGERERATSRATFFGLGALVLIAALAFGFLPQLGSAEQERLLRETREELNRSRWELNRVAQGLARAPRPEAPATRDTLPGAPPAESAGDPALTPRYDVVARLNEGGMGEVTLVVLRGAAGFSRPYVLKRLRPEFQARPEAVAQFIHEARLGASLTHPNIVQIYDFGRDAEGYFMTQEYVTGRTVDALLHETLRLDGHGLEARLVLRIAQQVLSALAYAHEKTNQAGEPQGIVHRDVSLNNLMVSERGEVKLLDFGIVKSEQSLNSTQAGEVKGNVFFMAPEQAQGQRVDQRSDLFSLGLVMFEALTGTPLYDGGSVLTLLNRCAAGPTAADLLRVRQLPSPLAEVISRAISVDPRDRFQDARSFAAAIEASLPVASQAELEETMLHCFAEQLAMERVRFRTDA